MELFLAPLALFNSGKREIISPSTVVTSNERENFQLDLRDSAYYNNKKATRDQG
jgi:hypothetical protein